MTDSDSQSLPSSLSPTDVRRAVPNALTLARVLLSLAFFAMLLGYHWQPIETGVHWRLLLAAVTFTLAAITDALDGYFARKWKAVTIFGRIMDPFADKFLVLGALALLAAPGFYWIAPGNEAAGTGSRGVFVSGVHPWMVVAILGRELLVTSIRGVLEAQGVAFPATWSGKAKMILQSSVVPVVLFLLSLPVGVLVNGDAAWPLWAIRILVWVTVIVSLWSGVPYATRAIAATRGSSAVGVNVRRVIEERGDE